MPKKTNKTVCLYLARGIAMAFSLVAFTVTPAIAGDVYVDGYYRSDGTYVRPHIRSAPDGIRSNNYGPSRSAYEHYNPYIRDYDRDGIPNYLDYDSDNDGIGDDYDSSPYSRSRY